MAININIKALALSMVVANTLVGSEISYELSVDSPFSVEQKSDLYKHGLKTLKYAGKLTYHLYGDEKLSAYLSQLENIKEIKKLSNMRFDVDILDDKNGLSTLSYDGPINVTLLFMEEMSKEEIENYLSEASVDAYVISANPSLRSANIRIYKDELKKLSNLHKIDYIQKSYTYGTKNIKTRKYEGVNEVFESYGLSGSGVSVAVVDGGLVRKDHVEFQENGYSRVITHGDYEYADHATHVAGTIAAKGVKVKAKGMAPKATVYSFSFNDGAFADIVTDIYNRYDVLFSNHSYGYNDMMKLGTYDAEAAKEDRAVYQNPYLNIFIAAGNDGENSEYPQYGKIKGPANAKNVLTIGALNLNASAVAKFSSNGPVKDGRIKPELCARGEGIYSTFSQNKTDYMWMNGTSMATPAATGMGVLLSEAYKKVGGGDDIRHDLLESVLVNSALDIGRKGPDYDSGFGMIDLKGAVKLIKSLDSSSPLLHEDYVKNSEVKRFNFKISNKREFKATISWVDPSASPSNGASLVNDLDMVLVSKSGKKYYPYTLNPSNPTQVAKQDRENHVDNVEQIYVKNLPSGEYVLEVKGSVVVTSKQDFAIASNVSISKSSNILILEPSKLKNFAKTIQASIQ